MSFATDAARWRALSMRDPTANNHFVYTVKSTQIYCRPICPARLARRANIGFCNTPALAEAAGYRACKRCKPNVQTIEDPQENAVVKACNVIDEAVQKGGEKEGLRLQDLAKSVGLTPRYFHKIFKDKMGVTPKEYAKAKMGEDSESGRGSGSGSERTIGTPQDGIVGLEPFTLDGFDFNDLVNFDMDDTLLVEDPLALPFIESSPSDDFGNEIQVNSQPILAAFDHNIENAGLGVGDKPFKWTDAGKYNPALMATTATFEMDAALVLNSGMLPDFEDDMFQDLSYSGTLM